MSEDTVTLSLLIEAGEAKPSGSIAPALGPLGLNLGEVVADINKQTAQFKGMKVPVTLTVVKSTRQYSIDVGLPPTSALILNEGGFEKGSGLSGSEVIGDISYEQVLKVAQAKRSDLLAVTLGAASKEVMGTMVCMGITVDGLDPREAQKKVDNGDYDNLIKKMES